MLKSCPDPKDVQDLQFKLQCRLKVFDNTNFSTFPTTHNLVSCASRYGLLFVGSNINSFQVIQTKQLHNYTLKDKDVSTYPRRNIELPSTPKHLSVNCDNTILAVVIEKNQCPVVIFYDVQSFLSSNVKVLREVRLSPTPNVFVKEVNWNPSIPGVFTTCKSDGSLTVYELKNDTFELNELPPAAGVTSFCWSPKGKQIAVGSKDGKITQYKPDLKPVKAINAPPLGGAFALICLQWVSNFQFIGVYQSAEQEGHACVVLVDAPKAGETSYTNYEDVCYSGSTRMPQFYFVMQQNWNLLMVASANSTEVGVLSGEGDKWTQWIIQDSARAELPLGSDHQETLPVGFGFDYSSTFPLPWGESQIPPCPTLLLLSHQGVLCCFNVVYLKKDIPTICTPPDNVADMSGLSAFIQGGPQMVETVQQPVAALASKEVPKNTQPDVMPIKPTATQSSQTSLFGGATSVASSNQQPLFGNSAVPASTQQPLFGGQTFAKPLFGGQQTNQKPGASLFGGQTTVTPTKSNSSSEKTLFGGQATITPISKSVTPQTPVTTTDGKYTKIFSSVQSPAAPASSAGTTQSTVVIKTEPKLPKKDETYAVASEMNLPKIDDQKLKAETNAMLSQMVRDECAHLEAELKAILHQTKTLNINVGTDQKKTHLVRELGSLEEFIKEVMDITSGQNSEIHCLKQNLIQSWALYEEATSHYNASKDEALNLLLKAQPLDSLAEKRLNDIKQMIYYVDSQLSQTNKALDAQWDSFQDYAKKIHRVKMPTMETIFQTMVRQNAVLQKQTYVLKDISMRLKKKNSTTNISLLRLNGKNQDLADNFSQLRLNSQDILQLQYDKMLSQLDSLSELKTEKLRNLLKRKPVTHVTAIKPNLSSWTINESPSKTKQMISLLGAHMSPVSKPPVARTLDFVQSTPMKPASAGLPTSMPFQNENKMSQGSVNAFAGLGNKPGTSAFVQPQKSTGFVAISSSSNATNLFKPGSSSSAAGATFTFASAQKPSFSVQQPKPSESTSKAGPTVSFGALNIPSSQAQVIVVDPFKKTETKVESTTTLATASNVTFSFGASKTPSTISTGFPSTSTTQPLFGGTTSFFGSLGSSAGVTKSVESIVSSSKPETSKATQVTSQTAATDLSKSTALTKAGLNLAPSVAISKDSKSADIQSISSSQPNTSKSLFGIAPSTQPTTKPTETVTVTNASTAFSFGTKPNSSTSTTTSSTTSIFGAPATSGSLFGQPKDDSSVTKAQPLFGAPTPTSSQSVFSSSSSQGLLFGSTSTAIPTPTLSSKPSLLSTPITTTSNIFGTTPTTPSPEAAKPVFGASSTSIFATPASTALSETATTNPNITTTAGSASLFGAGAGVGTSIFGAASVAKSTPEASDLSSVVSTGATNTGLFGVSATTTSVFETPVTSSVSSAPATAANLFGVTVSTVPSSTVPSSTTPGLFGSTTTPTAPNIFGASAITTQTTPPFGNAAPVTTTSSNIFAAPTATSSSNIFGSSASTATGGTNIFGSSSPGTTAASSFFGSSSATSTSASNIFAPTSPTSNIFGGNQSPAATTTANIFGGGQPAAATNETNVFGSFSTTSSSIFGTGTPAFGGQQSTSIFGGAQAQKPAASVFGQPTTFGTGFTAATTAQSVFGTPTTTQSVFGQGFGSTSPPITNTFGSPAAPVSQPSTQASFGFGSLSVGVGGTASSGGSIFGGGGGSTFGQQQQSSPSNPFGKSSFSGAASSNTSLFGAPGTSVASSGTNLFGTPTATSASTFGGGFGSPSTFGSSPAFGQNATFGSGTSFTSPPTGGAFSSGGAAGSVGAAVPVAQAGFGSPAFQKPAAGFGSPPVFGGSPTPAFGSAPAFGGAPAFGSAPVFGSPDKVFGQTSQQSTATFGAAAASQPSTGFGNLASQNTIGFGNLAQQANTQPSMPFSGGGGTSSFSSWR